MTLVDSLSGGWLHLLLLLWWWWWWWWLIHDVVAKRQIECSIDALSGQAPPYSVLRTLGYGRSKTYGSARSSTDRSCAVQRTRNTFGDRSFAAAKPRLWNSLPVHLRDEDISYNSFRFSVNSKRFGFNVASGAQCDILINCAIQILLLNWHIHPTHPSTASKQWKLQDVYHQTFSSPSSPSLRCKTFLLF